MDYYVEHVLAYRDKPTVNATIAEIMKVERIERQASGHD